MDQPVAIRIQPERSERMADPVNVRGDNGDGIQRQQSQQDATADTGSNPT